MALVSLIDEGLFSFAIGTTHYPYLRTLVECGADSKGWSGSPGCGDRDVVLERGARLGGALQRVPWVGRGRRRAVRFLCGHRRGGDAPRLLGGEPFTSRPHWVAASWADDVAPLAR